MPNTYVTFSDVSSNNLVREYTIPFLFLSKNDVKVISSRTAPSILSPVVWVYSEESFFNSTIVNGESNLPYGNYCVIQSGGNYKIKYTPPVNSTHSVTIFRRTDSSKISQFNNGSVIQAQDLNNIVLLSKYSSEEAIESAETANISNISVQLGEKYDKTGGSISGNVQVTGNISATGQLQAGSLQFPAQTLGSITNLATPINNNDAVNKNYVDLAVANGGGGGGGGNATIPDDSITAEKLRKVAGEEAVTTNAIRDGAVTSVKIGGGSVVSSNIASLAVTNSKIGTSAISSVKIQDLNVTTSKLATGSVTTEKIANGAVTAEKLASNNFDGSSILDNTLPLSKVKNSPFTHNAPTAGDIPNTTLTINSPISSSKSATFGNTNVGNLTEYAKLDYFPSLYLADDDPAARKFIYKENAISSNDPTNPNINFTASDLASLDGQPLVFQNLGTSTRKAGHFDYNIIVSGSQSAVSANIGATTIIRLLRQGNGATIGNPNIGLSDSKAIINYRSLSNILFNSLHPASGNPSISLNTTTGVITINNSGSMFTRPVKYLCILKGKAFVNDTSAYMFLFPPSDNPRTRDFFAGSESPDTMQTIMFQTTTMAVPFYCTSIVSVPQNTILEVSVKYWLTKTSGSTTPSTRTFASVSEANALINASPFISQLNGIINDPRVELVIQRIE